MVVSSIFAIAPVESEGSGLWPRGWISLVINAFGWYLKKNLEYGLETDFFDTVIFLLHGKT